LFESKENIMFVKNNLIYTVCIAVFFSANAAAGTASAQNADITALQRNPAVREAMTACLADRNRFCANVTPGGGRIARCLAAKSQDLSPACRTRMEKARDALIAAGVTINPDHAAPAQ
jgi:hypothetical protein